MIDKFMAEDGTEMAGWVVNLGAASVRPIDTWRWMRLLRRF